MQETEILKALSNVDDPDLHKDIVSLKMVENLEISGNRVSFDLVLTTPACPMKDMMVNACKTAIKMLVNKEAEVQVNATHRTSRANHTGEVLKEVKNIIAIASGKGGVGKSTVAAGLALALRESGASVGLLDADIYGPSVPTIFDVHHSPEMVEINGRNLMEPVLKQGIKLLSIGFMTNPEQPIVWRGPMISTAFKQFVNDVNWGSLDYLIIDLPPGTGDVQLTLCQQVPLSGIVIVSGPQKVAVADARRAISMFKMQGIEKPILGLVENMSYFVPEDAPDKRYFIFGQGGGKALAEEQAIPFLGELPMQSKIREGVDNGAIPVKEPAFLPFFEFAKETARRLSILNMTKD